MVCLLNKHPSLLFYHYAGDRNSKKFSIKFRKRISIKTAVNNNGYNMISKD